MCSLIRSTNYLILICFISINFNSNLYGSEKSCALATDFESNLEHLIDWCEKYRIPETQCDELLDSASKLSASDFRNQLYQYQLSIDRKTSEGPVKTAVKATLEADWSDIPKLSKDAFIKLMELTQLPGSGFVKAIEFKTPAKKYFNTLNAAETKTAFEIFEKIKNTKTKAELELYLSKKGGKYRVETSNSKNCTGKNVYSVRLSQGARMCFQYEMEDSSTIKILCIGQGRNCYDH
jgi:hypothetical protein